MATLFMDMVGGNDSNDGTSFANRFKTFTTGATSARTAPGDTIRIMQSPSPTSLGQSATWTNKSATVTLTTAVTADIFNCDSAFTASTNVTCSTNTTRKEGTASATVDIAAGFTTGLAAYKTISSTDFSAYKQVSFWIFTNADVAANSLRLDLCSDTAGATPVDSFTIDFGLKANKWHPITIDKGSALGSAIQSVALNVLIDPGAVNLRLDNIIACKDSTAADSLSLVSLIGKNTAGEHWWPIRSISGTTILLDIDAQGHVTGSTVRGYSGTSESVTTHKRETIKYAPVNAGVSVEAIQESGSSGSLITYSGGWNTTDMTTQTGETWIDARTSTGIGINLNSRTFINIEKVFVVRADTGFQMNSADCTFGDIGSVGSATVGISITSGGTRNDFTGTVYVNSTGGGAGLSASGGPQIISFNNISSLSNVGGANVNFGSANIGTATVSGTLTANNSSTDGMILTCGLNCKTMNVKDNGNHGLSITSTLGGPVVVQNFTGTGNTTRAINVAESAAPIRLYNFTTSGNGSPAIGITATRRVEVYVFNVSIAEASDLSSLQTFGHQRIYFHKNEATDAHTIKLDHGTITSVTNSDRHTLSGMAWGLSPTSTNATQYYPIRQSVARIAVNANTEVTFKIWVKRSNSALTGRIVIPGGQLAGVANDVVQTASGTAGTYEELTLNCTPTEAGVLEVFAEAWGGTSHTFFVDDQTITQA